jgi:undecaprenyl-diphosphatase
MTRAPYPRHAALPFPGDASAAHAAGAALDQPAASGTCKARQRNVDRPRAVRARGALLANAVGPTSSPAGLTDVLARVAMSPLIALLLGIVEGLTEYLPVSSTGHLILAGHLLGLPDDDATSSFEIVVQLGAILAVVAHYWPLLVVRVRGLASRDAESLRLFAALAIAFAPAAVVGLLFRKAIKAYLFGPLPVGFALTLGGVAMIVIERVLDARRKPRRGTNGVPAGPPEATGLEQITPGKALAVGIGQCLSLWPGTSRSMCTILAARLAGLSTATAAEFSFLLALPTLGAATLFEGIKNRHGLATQVGAANIAIGLVVSFLVAWGVIATFLRYLRTRGLEPFGWYRIAIGLFVLWSVRG